MLRKPARIVLFFICIITAFQGCINNAISPNKVNNPTDNLSVTIEQLQSMKFLRIQFIGVDSFSGNFNGDYNHTIHTFNFSGGSTVDTDAKKLIWHNTIFIIDDYFEGGNHNVRNNQISGNKLDAKIPGGPIEEAWEKFKFEAKLVLNYKYSHPFHGD